jgi:peptidoglycan/LPS O-acetylase OafA/YrhL
VDFLHRSGLSGGRPLSLSVFESTKGEIPSLDGLRAISILAVMLGHMGFPWVPGGHGVFLFFVISGFLISRLLFAELKESGKISLPNFYLRRFFRLYPVIIVYCAVISAIFLLKDGRISVIEPMSALFYFSNYLVASRDLTGVAFQMPFKIFWSLSVEEHFYIVFPFVMTALGTPRRVLMFAVGVCAVALGLRLLMASLYPELVATHFLYMRTEFRMDAVAYGVALAAACELPCGQAILSRLIHPFAFAATLAVSFVVVVLGDVWFANVVRYAILGPCVAILIAALVYSDQYRLLQVGLNLRPVAWVGRLSYSLYVWHIPCTMLTSWAMPGISGIVLAWPMSILTATASYYFIEAPAMRLRLRFGGLARPAMSI